jgi:hypothetical protein
MARMPRFVCLFALMLTAVIGRAATISVSSPNEGDFLGSNNSVAFSITGSSKQVTVRVTATGIEAGTAGSVITNEQKFTPASDGRVSGSVSLNFSPAVPEGRYRINVVATEPGNTYNTVPAIFVTVDVTQPKFINSNPIDGTFLRGIVKITASMLERNMNEYRVQVNNLDIPGNSGDRNNFLVRWDTGAIVQDGPQTISIRVTDKANNSNSRNISVTVDRLRPTVQIQAPNPATPYRPGSIIPVVIAIQDQFSGSVDQTGVDVTLRGLDGRFLGRVARRSARNDGTTLLWTGRIRPTSKLPDRFKIVVTATDRAGNVASRQEITLRVGGR